MRKLADTLMNLDWIILLILVVFLDGFVGGVIRVGHGRKTTSQVVGWIQIVSFVASLVSFISLPPMIGWVARLITAICWLADVVTVLTEKRIALFAD